MSIMFLANKKEKKEISYKPKARSAVWKFVHFTTLCAVRVKPNYASRIHAGRMLAPLIIVSVLN